MNACRNVFRLEQFDAEIDEIYDTASEEVRVVLEEQRKMVEFTISALRQQEKTPCSRCGYGGKHLDAPPCTTCPSHPKEQRPNAPLTLGELRQMDGEPVWTVTTGVSSSGRWELCTCETVCACPMHKVLRCVTADGEITDYDLDTYGKTWLAYRQRQEEDDHG